MMLRAFALIAFTLAAAQGVQAQGFLHKIKDKVKDKAGQRVDNQTDKAIDKGLDKTEGAITCVATDAKCVSDAKAQGKSVVVTDASGKPVSSADSAKAMTAAGGQGAAGAAAAPPTVNLNADFVPGTRTLFEENFAGDPVGDLPLHVKVKSGNWEIAQIGSRKVLRSGSGGRIMIPLPETLPDKFTLQIELQHSWGWSTDVWFVPDSLEGSHERVEFGSTGGIGDFNSAAPENKSNKLYLARMMVDGGHAKVYIDGKRVANVPEAKLGRSNGIWISATGSDEEPFILYDIRIAASQTSLFDALNASGRVATHGILFATNSATIEPGSDSTLK
ncbi:MAG TPA: hypothetical protein VFW98_01435, partial [Gemmatimonadaceae bacterium]|nr:hypothetical protein [Gemmatimonadaceae bacterium]